MKNWTGLLFFSFFCFTTYAWYPSIGKEELRLNLRSHQGLYGDIWTLEGAMLAHKVLKRVIVGGKFRLGQKVIGNSDGVSFHRDDSALGTYVSYGINEYLWVTLGGHYSATSEIGGDVFVHAVIPTQSLSFVPFVKTTEELLFEGGIIIYVAFKKASIHFGLSYLPSIGKNKMQNFVFIVGTTFDNGPFLEVERKRLKDSLNENEE